MKQPLAFLSLVAGFILFPASFFISEFVYSEFMMGTAIICILLSMHLQAKATVSPLEKEVNRVVYEEQSMKEAIQKRKSPLMPLTQNEMSSIVNQ